MTWGEERKNGSTTNPSKYWARELGIDSREELLRKQYEPETTPDEELTNNTYDRLQVIEMCKSDLNFLAAMAMPVTFKFFFPATHITAWHIMVNSLDDPEIQFPQIALGIPRGHAKTTLIKLFVLYCVLFSNKKFILATAATEPRAMDIIADVVDMLDETNIKGTFGDWRLGLETDTKSLKKFGFRDRNVILAAIGAEGAVRGLNIKNARPDVMIFDDIQTRECADSKLQSDTLERWMIGTAMKAKSPAGCLFIYSGNMFPTSHSILKKLKMNGSWIKFISGGILADGSALWPELRSLDSLIEELNNDIAMGHPEIFFSEVLNDTEAGVNTSVDFSKFPAWEWTKDDLPQGKFLVVDPSQGKGLDSDVIGRFEVYDGILGCRELVEEKLSPGNLIRKALILAIRNNISLIAVESMAYQYTLLYWFEEVCKTAGITGIVCVPIYATNHSKNSRIASGLKAMQSREIILHNDIRSRVQKQIADWNPMKRDNVDDILDIIAYAPKVLAEYTYDIMSNTNLMVIEADGAVVRDDNHLF